MRGDELCVIYPTVVVQPENGEKEAVSFIFFVKVIDLFGIDVVKRVPFILIVIIAGDKFFVHLVKLEILFVAFLPYPAPEYVKPEHMQYLARWRHIAFLPVERVNIIKKISNGHNASYL